MKEIQKFITVEGIDGSGKSTFIPIIEQMLKERGEDVVLTREPGGTPLAETLREKILNDSMHKTTELLLAFAARNENINDVIKPALAAGKTVLCDRFTDSTYAYQVSGHGVPFEYAEVLEHMVQNQLKPGLTLIFSVPTEVSRQRLDKTGKTPDKFESKDQNFFQKVIDGYQEVVDRDPERCKLIDSSKTIEDTKEQVIKIVKEYFNKLDQQEALKNNKKQKKTI